MALADIVSGLKNMSNNMVTRANPQYGVVENQLENQQKMRSVLQQMADQMQQDQQQPGANGSAPPAATPLQRYANVLNQAAQANPTPENFGAAVQAQSPYFSQMMQMNAQQKEAEIENKKSETVKNAIIDTPTGKVLVNPNTGEQVPVGQHIYASPDVQKLHDLNNFSQTLPSSAPAVTPLQSGEPTATPATAEAQPNSVSDLIKAAYRTPDQQAAATATATEKAKNLQEAQQDVVNTKAATADLIPALNQLDSLNSDPNLPSVLPDEVGQASNVLHKVGLTNGRASDLVNQWNQTNGQKLVGGIKAFTSSGSGSRLDLPIAHALMNANGIDLSGTASGRADRINQARIELYNSNIVAQNRAAQFSNPNAKSLPTIPLNFKGKIYTMAEIENGAAAKKIPLEEALKRVKASGSLVVQ